MKLNREFDTICAISTPLGPGGIGIVRMSGPASPTILQSIFSPASKDCTYESHRLYYGHIIEPDTGNIVDEALCAYMKAPHSYTREDVVEIQCHSGPAVLTRILQLCVESGARLAEPGEFTKRAFLNGRIGLDQAEAIMDMISAQGQGLCKIAAGGLSGALGQKINNIRDELLFCLSALEVAIDYPEDIEEIVESEKIAQRLEHKVVADLKELINAFERTKIQRFGARVMLLGKPNVGKSSLMNALSCEERAIVTDIPGTTRDVIEKNIDIGGIPVILTDTAGIRNAPDPIERIGMEKTKEFVEDSILLLWMLDLEAGFSHEDAKVAEFLTDHDSSIKIMIFNKKDAVPHPDKKATEMLEKLSSIHANISSLPKHIISAKKHEGIEELISEMERLLISGESYNEISIAPNLRQKELLEKTLLNVEECIKGLIQGISPELITIDLRQALQYLGEITGETATEDILDEIFSKFCLGK